MEADTNFVTVLCTGQVMKFDMAVNALKEAGIAHQVRAETSTGLKLAVPVMPASGRDVFSPCSYPSPLNRKPSGCCPSFLSR